jgi:glucose/mannose transport system permease protein
MKRPEPMLYLIAAATVAVLSFAYLLPIYVMLMTALKTPAEITQRIYLLPGASAQLENFATAWRLIRPAMANSAFIALAVTGAALLFGSMGGYFLSRSRSLIARALFLLIGIALYLPYQVILIPLVQVMARTGLALTHAGLIFSYLVLNMPLASVLMGTFFLSIPRELEEAAALDGASRLQTFARVVVPLSLPAYASTALIVFTQVWNEFLLALTLATPRTTTIQIKLAEIKGSYVALYNLQMAAALITALVPLVLFLLTGRLFVRGLLAGALRG